MQENYIQPFCSVDLWTELWDVGNFVFLVRQDRSCEYFILILINFCVLEFKIVNTLQSKWCFRELYYKIFVQQCKLFESQYLVHSVQKLLGVPNCLFCFLIDESTPKEVSRVSDAPHPL